MRYPASRRGPKCACAALLVFAAALFPPLHPALGADPRRAFNPSINDFGGTGLLQMPNARFPDDGELNFGVSHIDPYTRGFLTLQVLPWLEGSFRYTNIGNRLFGPESFSGTQKFKDRGFDAKIRLIEETRYFPQVAIGLRDIGGTNLFGSEFFVLGRRYYNWDLTLGLAWGNAGSRDHFSNPLGFIHNGFKTRTGSEGPGKFAFNFFRGESVAVFGGVEYITPVKGLRLKLEYDGNSYQREPLGSRLESNFPINVGAEYDLFPSFRVSAAFERGNAFMIRANLHANLNTEKGMRKIDHPPPPVQPRPDGKRDARDDVQQGSLANAENFIANADAIKDSVSPQPVDWLYDRFEKLGLDVADFAFEGKSVILRIPVDQPRPSDGNLARAALDVSRSALTGPVDSITFLATRHNAVLSRMTFKTAELERSMVLTGSPIALVNPPGRDWTMAFETKDVKVLASSAKILNTDSKAGAVKVILERRRQSESGRKIGRGTTEPNKAARIAAATGGTTVRKKSIEPIADRVFSELQVLGFVGEHLNIDGPRATLHMSQQKYRNPAKAIGRAARVLARHAPDEVEEFIIALTNGGIPISQTTIMRTDLERAVVHHGSPEEIWQHAEISPAGTPGGNGSFVNDKAFPGLGWTFLPRLRQQIGGPDKFYFYQIYAQAGAQFQFSPGLSASGSIGINIFNNFEDLRLESNSQLPRVRSDIKDYLKEGEQWVENLHADYITRLAPELYGRLSGGIFELMFGGVGGEMLYRPVDQRWALGLDLNYVQQRDFDGRFGFRDYTVLTGHLSYYYRLPFHELLAIVRAGQYLAKDRGVTLELSRTFDNGLTFGIFATKTNVSSEEFGEGSFDKGFYLSVPLDIFYRSYTRRRAGLTFRPVTRDGGQMLAIPLPLYGVTDETDGKAIGDGWPEILK